ncbi:hypothetical protein FP371_25075 [Citrobacter freundii]|uniref:hypothetical protein n=1 Tax=Citrobacter freundii TaxID=546 RepID=UPI001C986F1B|nr:hypothetical protein [Citrobacter freundii]MBY5301472.1 hypothetical protein [Citrobacter freundii]
MAKATRVFSGHNAFGIRVQVAERVDGQWFSRSYYSSYNHYGRRNGWSAYHPVESKPVHPTQLKNLTETGGAPEYIDLPEESRAKIIEWGFTYLHLEDGPNRLRLPE